jgi:hypothetical protein
VVDATRSGAEFASAMPRVVAYDVLEIVEFAQIDGGQFLHAKCKMPLFWAKVGGTGA